MNEDQEQNTENYRWTSNNTKMLLDLYNSKRKDVGTLKLKTVKHMWQQIAKEINALLQINVTWNQCENRWRVIERGYKKFIDNKNATGRGRKFFEYENEMEEILGKKKNLFPELILNTATVHVPQNVNKENVINIEEDENLDVVEDTFTNRNKKTKTATPTKRKNRMGILEKIRNDRLQYYDKRLKIEEEKVNQLKLRNEYIKERNEILKDKSVNCNI